MYIGSLWGKTDIATAVAASLCVALSLAEYGYKRAIGVYAVTAVLSCLLIPSKTAAVLFTAFFGYYPVLKTYVEYRFDRVKAYILKYAAMNTSLVIMFVLALQFAKVHILVIAGVFVGANILLPVYDIAFAWIMNVCYEKLNNKLS